MIVVTGAAGGIGRAVVTALRAAGHEVLEVDIVPTTGDGRGRVVDLEDLGATMDVLHGADAVVHLAGVPGPRLTSDAQTFRVNVMGTFNVFWSAVRLGIPRVVWASTESVYGVPFAQSEPDYAPLDEAHPLRPETAYAFSKAICERQAELLAGWGATSFVGLRIAHVMDDADYDTVSGYWDGAHAKAWDLWSHVHILDVVDAVRRGLSASVTGATIATVSAVDTVMPTPTRDLLREAFSDRLADSFDGEEHAALFANNGEGATLGLRPQRTWRTL